MSALEEYHRLMASKTLKPSKKVTRDAIAALEARLAERDRTIEVLTRAVNGLAERTPECKHQWVIYNSTAPSRTCSRCGQYETLPVTT